MPGQTRPFAFEAKAKSSHVSILSLSVSYTLGDSPHVHTADFETSIPSLQINQPVKSTFLTQSRTVAYCIIVAPVEDLPASLGTKTLPVLLSLHGAGVTAESPQVRHQLDSVLPLPAWTVIPEGGTPWCGDDWRKSLRKSFTYQNTDERQTPGVLQMSRLQLSPYRAGSKP